MDPLAQMLLHSDSFRAMTNRVQEGDRSPQYGSKLVMVHEGGYAESLCTVLRAVAAVMGGVERRETGGSAAGVYSATATARGIPLSAPGD